MLSYAQFYLEMQGSYLLLLCMNVPCPMDHNHIAVSALLLQPNSFTIWYATQLIFIYLLISPFPQACILCYQMVKRPTLKLPYGWSREGPQLISWTGSGIEMDPSCGHLAVVRGNGDQNGSLWNDRTKPFSQGWDGTYVVGLTCGPPPAHPGACCSLLSSFLPLPL